MTTTTIAALVSLSILLPAARASARTADAKRAAAAKQADIRRALSAAPAAIARGAAVIDMDDQGRTTELRPGTNGWTCMPRDPGTPVQAPLCVDRAGLAWFQAVMAGRPPDPKKVGYSYMLKGGTAWSIVDPAATKLPPGETTHVTVPPHIMVMNARVAEESGFPSGEAHPDVHKPFVAYGGTPYAILLIPLE